MKKLLFFIGILFFSIAVQAQIVVNENPYPLIVCDDDNDGYAYFDLHLADADITLGNNSLFVTYHQTFFDAQASINALISPYMNTTPYSDMVFARAYDSANDIFAIVELDLLVVENLPIPQPVDLFQTDDNGDGLAIFDLTENDAIVMGGLNPSYFTVSYYETEANAEIGQSVIATPMAYQNIGNPQTIYVRVENMDGSCDAIASFIISVGTLSTDSFGFENLNVFPNPTSGNITIQSSQLTSETIISVYDILGKMLLSEKILPQNSAVSLNISSFENGVYFVKTSSEGNVAVQKLIKK